MREQWGGETGEECLFAGEGRIGLREGTSPQERRVAHPNHEPGTSCDPIFFGEMGNLLQNFILLSPSPNPKETLQPQHPLQRGAVTGACASTAG